MSDNSPSVNTLTIDFAEFYNDGKARAISNASLNKVRSRFGVKIDVDANASGVYVITDDSDYGASYGTQAAEALRRMHRSLAGAPSRSANEILNKRNIEDILSDIPGRARRKSAEKAPPVAKAFKTASVADASPERAMKAASARKLVFGDEPWISINTFQGRSLADIHAYLSKQNRESFLEEFERKMGVQVQLNKDLGFDVILPTNHEGPIHSNLISRIEIALINLQSLREKATPVTRALVQNEINKVITGRLTPDFAKEAQREAQSSLKQAVAEASAANSGVFAIFNTVSAAGKRLIGQIKLPRIEGRSDNQKNALANMKTSDVAYVVAPAGTGKTFLAVAALLELLVKGEVNSLVITRPAVEAGERLGFLPGDANEKMDPFLVPIYNSFEKLLAGGDIQRGKQMLKEMIDAGVIVISPIAFMRGGEFQRKGVLLDEGQNATETQLKMFLTRLGVGGRMIITGDPEQTDLKPASNSVFLHFARTFEAMAHPGVTTSWMTADDAVRHPLMPFILKTFRDHPVPAGYSPYAVGDYAPAQPKKPGPDAPKP